jgi:hypothetical protein
MSRRLTLSLACLSACLLAACSANLIVPLEYHATGGGGRGGCDHTIALVTMRDVRTEKALGIKIDDGAYFEPGRPVSDWVSRALYDELKLAGCQVEYHDTGAGFGTYYEISGEIEKLWFEERYKTKYNVALRFVILIHQDGALKERKEFTYAKERLATPGLTTPAEVMEETLQEAMQDVVAKLLPALR